MFALLSPISGLKMALCCVHRVAAECRGNHVQSDALNGHERPAARRKFTRIGPNTPLIYPN